MNVPSPAKAAIIKLLQGPVYRDRDESNWQAIGQHETLVRDYLAVIGLDLHLDESDGFAFLRQAASDEPEGGEAEPTELPKLIRRQPLPYDLSLLLVLLRKRLIERDQTGGESLRVVVTRSELRESLSAFLPERGDETKLAKRVDALLNKAISLGVLRRLRDEQGSFELRPIIKALVDADWLGGMQQAMETYREHAGGESQSA